jgi:hypothetical protein
MNSINYRGGAVFLHSDTSERISGFPPIPESEREGKALQAAGVLNP